ncbi:MAG: DUF4192 domain-containing protein [Candidatus Nanopelagicales bacterium]|jgi:hypothetical protein|nr:DUF4192 domain-containing protein [Candidatus Nanopelagicales bacterium]
MTAEPVLPPITCPSGLVASCAPLLGFAPERSLVAFIHGVPGRVSPVVLRVDLPTCEQATQAAAQIALSIQRTGGLAVDWVAWVEDSDALRREDLSSATLLLALASALDMLGIEVGANLSTNGRMWWSHTCMDPTCCPPQGTPLDSRVVTAVRAEYVYAGYAPLGSRDDLATRIVRNEPLAAEVQQALFRRSRPQATQRWREAQITFLTGMLLPRNACGAPRHPLTASRAVRVIRALDDIRVRDVVLHRLVVRGHHCDRCWETTIEVLCDALRMAPDGAAAPLATITGLVTWMRGQGALASLCIERALDEDPEYRLARLASQLMAGGCDPRAWRDSLSGLPESECRNPGGP